jgi:UDP-N-acetylglucosamine 4,6-dehydratase
MTRFFITLDQTVDFVIKCFELMHGGELFVPRIPSVKIVDLAKALAPKCKIKIIGIRPGEKLHEVMVSEDDSRNTLEFKNWFIVKPSFPWWNMENHRGGKNVKEGFRYASNTNRDWLEGPGLKKALREI